MKRLPHFSSASMIDQEYHAYHGSKTHMSAPLLTTDPSKAMRFGVSSTSHSVSSITQSFPQFDDAWSAHAPQPASPVSPVRSYFETALPHPTMNHSRILLPPPMPTRVTASPVSGANRQLDIPDERCYQNYCTRPDCPECQERFMPQTPPFLSRSTTSMPYLPSGNKYGRTAPEPMPEMCPSRMPVTPSVDTEHRSLAGGNWPTTHDTTSNEVSMTW
jgi:hypothetical protein